MQTKEQAKQGSNLLFGLRPVIEAIKDGKEIDKLLVQTGLKNELFTEMMGLLKKHNIPYQYVPLEKLNHITQKNHQGVIGYISEISYHKIAQILPTLFEQGITPLVLVLDRITDVRNFGAIVRTAECAGVQAIIIPTKGAAQINADAIKTSAGAIHKVKICREDNFKEIINYLRESGLFVIACTEKSEELYFQHDYTLPTAFMLGSEENGISSELINLCDATAKIPLLGSIASLNVSVAAGIILFEAVRQREISG